MYTIHNTTQSTCRRQCQFNILDKLIIWHTCYDLGCILNALAYQPCESIASLARILSCPSARTLLAQRTAVPCRAPSTQTTATAKRATPAPAPALTPPFRACGLAAAARGRGCVCCGCARSRCPAADAPATPPAAAAAAAWEKAMLGHLGAAAFSCISRIAWAAASPPGRLRCALEPQKVL